MKTSAVIQALARVIDELRDQEMSDRDERRAAEDERIQKVADDRDERELRALELAARSLERLSDSLLRISTQGIPGMHR